MFRSRWRVAIAMLAASWAVVVCLYWQTAASMVAGWWRSGTFTHGFAVVPISLYVMSTRREQLALLAPSANPWALPLLALLAGAWLIGNLVNLLVLQQLALVGALQALAWGVLGTQVSRALLFPLAFLFFAVPIGEELVPLLQDFTAFFTAHALRATGVPLRWEGRVLFTPSGQWYVAEACSGVRYLIPAVCLGCLFSAITYRSWSRRLGFALLCVAVPILANGARAYGIVLLGHLSNRRIAVGIDHQLYGWVFFGIVMYLLFTLGGRWRDSSSRSSLGFANVSAVPRSPAAAMVTACAGVLLLAIAPAVGRVSSVDHNGVVVTATPPSVRLPWSPVNGRAGQWKPLYRGPAAEVQQSYQSLDGDIDLYIGYYVAEQQGAELVNSENRLTSRKGWKTVRDGQRSILVDGQMVRVRETILRPTQGRSRLVWSWFWVADEFTSSATYAKFLRARTQLFGGVLGAAVITLTAEYDDAPAQAVALLHDFVGHSAAWRDTLSGFAAPVSPAGT